MLNHFYREVFIIHCGDEFDHREGFEVRLYNSHDTHTISDLMPNLIDTLSTVTGRVIKVSNIIPDMRVGFFRQVT